MGVAGAGLTSSAILVTGLTGLLAVAGSMAIGGMCLGAKRPRAPTPGPHRGRRDLLRPDEAQKELALIYEAKGLPSDEAEPVAEWLVVDEAAALDVMVREELGLDPATLGGSPYSAGGSSFVPFALGAIIPLLPYFFGGGLAVVASIGCAALGLFVIGALITLLTGRRVIFSATRQLIFGLLAAGVTFGLGRLIGSAVGA
jgi:VIT1/CCC1 family predicted Fe2+/Mn2+ transporter